jgi:hypothetical protein
MAGGERNEPPENSNRCRLTLPELIPAEDTADQPLFTPATDACRVPRASLVAISGVTYRIVHRP